MADPTTTGFDPKPRTLEARLGFAFQQQERTGLKLAAHLRAFAMAAITIWIFVLLGSAFWFYLPVIILFVISGYAHYLFSLRGFRGDGHAFLFFVVDVVLVIIALFALVSYSARAMMFAGFAYVIAWGAGLVWVSTFPATVFDIPGFDYSEGRLSRFLDPYYVSMDVRIMEILVLLLTTAILATAVARGRRLIREQVYMARERSNLARYFPPSIADEIAVHDSVLGKVRSQNVAVMFVDMVGFAHMAETVSPEELIDMLRAFHRRVEAAVFEHAGTLDKFFWGCGAGDIRNTRARNGRPGKRLAMCQTHLRSDR
jgi:adenylate cyclase